MKSATPFPPKKLGVSIFALRLAGFCAVLTLTACGGGGGGSDSGGGQDPDPVVVDLPIAYVKRPLPFNVEDGEVESDNVLNPAAFNPGAALYVRDRAAPGAEERNITDRAWPEGALYDVKDVEASYDGDKLVFAMRGPEDPDADDDEQPKWDIWEYELPTDTLRRVMSSEISAQLAHDVAPVYLPDDRIVFSSDRQQRSRSILLDDGKPQYGGLVEPGVTPRTPAFVLHVMDDDGSGIDQLTYNQSHDLQPTVLEDGRILFLRLDNYNGGTDTLSLYTVMPDGSNLQFYYGIHSQETGTENSAGVFSQPRQIPDGRILVTLRPRQTERFGGDLVFIDGDNFTELDEPTYANAGAAGPGQVSASPLPIDTRPDQASRHGRYNGGFPFFDGTDRILVSWNQCRLVNPNDETTFLPCTEGNLADPNAEEAEALYGIWIFNPQDETQLPVIPPEPGFLYTDVVAMEPRTAPTYIQPKVPGVDVSQSLIDEGVGVVNIRNVYDFAGVSTEDLASISNSNSPAYATRPARFIRIIKAVSEPERDVRIFNGAAFGVGGQRMKEILGYVPIEPDGSAMFKVPADVAFTISLLNRDGHRIGDRHENWMQVRAGDELKCNGCHLPNSTDPHGRFDAEPPSSNQGTLTGSFPGTQPPIAENAHVGDTMAEAYARHVPTSGATAHGPRTPNVNLVFQDEWTLGTAETISRTYGDATEGVPVAPTSSACETNWAASCRVLIHYPTHIQPIWEADREDELGNSITCTNCHNKVGLAGTPIVPAGQLELTSGPLSTLNSHEGANELYMLSYRELFFNDVQLELNAGATALQRVVVIDQNEVIDPDTGEVIQPLRTHNPICEPSMRGGSAAGSSNPRGSVILGGVVDCDGNPTRRDFLSWFTEPGDHYGYLTEGELKLISEWLDIGAQYFNDPFVAPEN